jgi:hypothetical protein
MCAGKKFAPGKNYPLESAQSACFQGHRSRHVVCHSPRRVAGLIKTRQVRELGELGRLRMQGHRDVGWCPCTLRRSPDEDDGQFRHAPAI